MTFLWELAAIGLALGYVVLWILWQRARGIGAAREKLWSAALDAVATRNHEEAAVFAGKIDDNGALRRLMQTVESLEAAELREQHARRDFEDVLASLQDGVLFVDRESRLRYLNSAALGFFGVRVEDVLGAQVLEALPSFGLDAAVRMALDEGKNDAREVRLYAPLSREIFLRVTPVRQADGAVSGAVATLQDLTELRRLERVRRDFVANASHELRTPIATIRAMAETVLSDADNPELARRFLPSMVSEAERLSRLVNDLLELARIESRDDTPDAMPRAALDLCDVTRQVVGHLEDKARQNNVAIHCELPGRALVQGEAAGIEQIVFNLLDNALAYTPSGGNVRLIVSRPAVKNGGQGFAMLSVQDTGIGIPAGELPRVFERFYRVDKARSRAQGGTGLGLAIVKHIVESHNGYIEVESEAGQGTLFRVMLPAV